MKSLNSTSSQILISKYLPHNFLAEKTILSCLLINADIIDLTIQVLPIEAFYFKNHQEIYQAIISLHKKETSVDILMLITFLQDSGRLQEIGGVKVLIELISQLPNLIYIEEYLSLVKDKFIRRSLIKLGYELVNSAYITSIPLENILQELENKLFYLTNSNTTHKSEKFFKNIELLDQIFSDLKEKSLNPKLSGVSSRFYELDAFTQGFQKADLTIIAGRPSMGKTAFGLNITSNIIKHLKLPVLFFSLEMSREQIMYRLLSMETGINQMKLKSGKLYHNDWIKLNKIIKVFSKLPLFIDDTFDLSIQDIRSKIKTLLFEQNKIGLVIIDYMQLLRYSKLKMENRTQELSQITRSLKLLAREFDIPIIALSQLSRNVENRINKKPILADLRESGSIEQDADLVILLYRSNYYNPIEIEKSNDQIIELIIAKQRNGPTGTVNLKFNENYMKFSNVI